MTLTPMDLGKIEKRVRSTICQTYSARQGVHTEGRISEADFEALVAAARGTPCDYPKTVTMTGRAILLDLLYRFREYVIQNTRGGLHHHNPIWAEVAQVLDDNHRNNTMDHKRKDGGAGCIYLSPYCTQCPEPLTGEALDQSRNRVRAIMEAADNYPAPEAKDLLFICSVCDTRYEATLDYCPNCPAITVPDMSLPELDALRRIGGSLTVGTGVAEIFDELRTIAVAYAERTTKVESLLDTIVATAFVNAKREGEAGNHFARLLAEWMKPEIAKLKELRTRVVTS